VVPMDKGFWSGNEWKLKTLKTHYALYENNVGLVRVKCKYCEYVVIAEKSQALFALNLMHKHLHEVHNMSYEDIYAQ
jgi:hypothetical protein